ncbi:hypothetical protein D9619_011118 [Psilocybe cf. subviscida]|uniref:Uncharacterized protein n=1 Tax=Psilocybe cf. subviscida TaxID=2480587 RepID=A0A8H5BL64_9AGAR|nr:hypothetical protein D9619_011118 [Psilocybe cf. subviscida]
MATVTFVDTTFNTPTTRQHNARETVGGAAKDHAVSSRIPADDRRLWDCEGGSGLKGRRDGVHDC